MIRHTLPSSHFLLVPCERIKKKRPKDHHSDTWENSSVGWQEKKRSLTWDAE